MQLPGMELGWRSLAKLQLRVTIHSILYNTKQYTLYLAELEVRVFPTAVEVTWRRTGHTVKLK